jgi:hypothetical protein
MPTGGSGWPPDDADVVRAQQGISQEQYAANQSRPAQLGERSKRFTN